MKITKHQLIAIIPNAQSNIRHNKHYSGYTIDDIVSLLNKYAESFEINTPLRWAHYLAQIAHESGEFRYTEEIASGKAYDTGSLAVKLGNTPQADGDGQKYKGRGLIQLTGTFNYSAYKNFCGYDVLKNPELLSKPVGSIRSSMWYWKKKSLNYYADRDDFKTITLKINGGYNGIEDRKKKLDKAKKVLL